MVGRLRLANPIKKFESKLRVHRISEERTNMKITFLKIKLYSYLCCLGALVCVAHGQSPTASPDSASAAMTPVATLAAPAPAAPPVAPLMSATPVASPSDTPDNDDDFDRKIEKKIRKHFTFDLDGDHSSGVSSDDVPWIAIPIVLIVFLTIFGLPVAIVGLIMYFSFSKSRNMHKTVRMMVEKGQPVPEALLNPPPVVRKRSDLRRGVTLLMVGAGLMVFFGACNDWEGGAWSLGIIPFLIGLGYLLVWRLDVHKEEPSPKV
jgi:hypothetical protein